MEQYVKPELEILEIGGGYDILTASCDCGNSELHKESASQIVTEKNGITSYEIYTDGCSPKCNGTHSDNKVIIN